MTSQKMIDKRRVLLMYITRVSGHRQATVAIQRALKELDPSLEAPAVNGFGHTYPVLEKVVNQAYMCVIKTTPQVWDYMYDNPKLVKHSKNIQNFLYKTSHDKIKRLFDRHQPDTVVCTQAFPCGMVSDYKRTHGLKTKIIGVLTDFAPHSYWINEGVDYYIVPSDHTRDQFIAKGVNPDKIKVYGIPLRSKFSQRLSKAAVAKKIGFDSNIPTVLIMGGGQGLGPIKATVKSLMKTERQLQIVAIVGTNGKMVDSLKKYADCENKKLLVYKFANNVDELMDLADLIITKPGGMTTAESLAKGLPMIIINPIPGQEMHNTDFIISRKLGMRVDSPAEIGSVVDELLNNPEQLKKMSEASYHYAKPHAAKNIANLICAPTQKSSQQEQLIPELESVKLDHYV